MDIRKCAVCNAPADSVLVIEDKENELRIGLCQQHGFDVMNIKVRLG